MEDHPIVREGLTQLIQRQSNLSVCGETGRAEGALEMIGRAKPDLVLVDLTLKTGSGLDLVKQIVSAYPRIQVLVVSMHDEELFAERAMRAGARGYIMKQAARSDLLEAIDTVLQGKVYLSLKMRDELLNRKLGGAAAGGSDVRHLSNREMEVFRLIGEGFRTREIAEKLHLSVKTIESYRECLKNKLGVKGGSDLLRRAIAWATNRTSPAKDLSFFFL